MKFTTPLTSRRTVDIDLLMASLLRSARFTYETESGRCGMAYDARSVANEFLRQAKRMGTTLTNMELQKLVYIKHGYSLAILDKSLIKQSVEAWRYGPVIPDLYHSLREYGAGIVRSAINIFPDEKLSETDIKLVSSVLNAYVRFSGPQLSTMTHRDGTPWKAIYQPGASFNNDTIPLKLIKEHYLKLLNERAGIAAQEG